VFDIKKIFFIFKKLFLILAYQNKKNIKKINLKKKKFKNMVAVHE
jgi:hypothetical protein